MFSNRFELHSTAWDSKIDLDPKFVYGKYQKKSAQPALLQPIPKNSVLE